MSLDYFHFYSKKISHKNSLFGNMITMYILILFIIINNFLLLSQFHIYCNIEGF